MTYVLAVGNISFVMNEALYLYIGRNKVFEVDGKYE